MIKTFKTGTRSRPRTTFSQRARTRARVITVMMMMMMMMLVTMGTSLIIVACSCLSLLIVAYRLIVACRCLSLHIVAYIHTYTCSDSTFHVYLGSLSTEPEGRFPNRMSTTNVATEIKHNTKVQVSSPTECRRFILLQTFNTPRDTRNVNIVLAAPVRLRCGVVFERQRRPVAEWSWSRVSGDRDAVPGSAASEKKPIHSRS